jgi:uridine phosphorylase
MLRTLGKDDWLQILALRPEQVPSVLLLRGTRNLRRRYEHYISWMSDPVAVGSPNGLFEDVAIGRIDDKLVGYASVYGPAMASEIAHVFGILGTSQVVLTGVCGGLAAGIGPGDLVIATSAGCGEGAVECYLPGTVTVEAAPLLIDAATGQIGDHPAHTGPIWTTSALLAEGEAELTAWRDSGHIAVDMETATVYGVSRWIGMDAISVLSVFDNPFAGTQITHDRSELAAVRSAGELAADRIVRHLLTIP